MKANVLLVDEDAAVRSSLARVLETADLTVIQAANEAEALERISRHPVNLILLDLSPSEGNGWDAARKLTARNPMLPVVVMAARPDQLAQADAVGVRAFLEKPPDFHKLLQTVKELLDNSDTARGDGRRAGMVGARSPRATGAFNAGAVSPACENREIGAGRAGGSPLP